MVERQPAPVEAPVHVSGIIVHAPAERAAEAAAAIAALPGAEIFAREGGRMVVVLEAADAAGLNDLFCHITLLENVLSAALVSHYRDDPQSRGGA